MATRRSADKAGPPSARTPVTNSAATPAATPAATSTEHAADTTRAASRALWKGAISFGLVHVPVALHAATQEHAIDFDWLDRRTLDPVGYKRVNKRTGQNIDKADIVKGVKLEGQDYVLLSDDEIRQAFPKRTQTIALESFVQAAELSFAVTDRPYYLVPEGRAGRVYALLREALTQAGVVGIARFVLHNKEHLAALIPAGPALMLATLRWADELRSPEGLALPPEGAAANGLKPAELTMARQLIAEMTRPWQADEYQDEFTAAIQALVARKAEDGDKATVTALDSGGDAAPSNVVDLSELLRQSLRGGRPSAAPAQATASANASKRGKNAKETVAKAPARRGGRSRTAQAA